jgi:hypothetical protein
MPDPDGLLFHAGVGEDDDFFTVSVWESREAYDAFASRFKEALGAEGYEGGAPKILPVHHTIDHGLETVKQRPRWRDLPSPELAEYLLSHPTIADQAWTDEPRRHGENRTSFIRRLLQ